MEKAIPILLIASIIGGFNPLGMIGGQDQLYVVDVSAITSAPSGVERFVSDAEIKLVSGSTGQEVKPTRITAKGTTFTFYARRGDDYRIDVQDRGHRVLHREVLDLKGAKKYTWKVVRLNG